MKIATLAAVATIAATSVSAADLGTTGISLGAELDTYYDFDTEGMQSVLTPEVGYNRWGVDFTASTDLTIVENDSFVVDEILDDPIISLGAGYTVDMGLDARVYGEVDVDKDLDTTGAKMGVQFKF